MARSGQSLRPEFLSIRRGSELLPQPLEVEGAEASGFKLSASAKMSAFLTGLRFILESLGLIEGLFTSSKVIFNIA